MTERKTRRYTIEVKDIDTGQTAMLTAVDWTAGEKRFAVLQIMRLAGVTLGGAGNCFLDQVAPDGGRDKS